MVRLSTDTNQTTPMNLAARKQITDTIAVVAILNQVQVRIGDRVEYCWFCNAIPQARSRWVEAVAAARNLASRLALA
jgi:hypothetical protein